MKNEQVCNKMLTYIDKIMNYCNNENYNTFISNDMLVEACVFNLSQLGELVGELDKEFREQHSNVPWKQIYGLRNKIVHDYDGVNLQLVWEIISDDIPELREILESI